jgi:two-component system, OmpR family, response regulator
VSQVRDSAVMRAEARPLLGVMTRSDGSPVRALVVDNEPLLAEVVASALRYQGWATTTVGYGAAAIRVAREKAPDMSGLDVLAQLRRERPSCPVLLVSANDSLEDRLAGLSAGGDDYVTKPFNLEELALRIRGLLRRAGVASVGHRSTLVVGDLVLDEGSRQVSRAGDPIDLTTTEFEVLRYLMHNRQRVVSKGELLDKVWKCGCDGRPNNVEIYVSYLRRKIDSGRDPMIHTLRGVGYIVKAVGR